MKFLKTVPLLMFCLFTLSAVAISCGDDTIYVSETTPSQILASTKWKTTIVKDENGNDVTAAQNGFVGNAEFKADGTYIIKGFDDSLRSIGDWAITADGKKRILVGKNLNGSGEIIFTRIVDIITLTPKFFVYSIMVNGQKFTVEHIPLQ